MFLLRQPSEEHIQQFIRSQRELPFSYPEVGATKTESATGYNIDHNRIKLGEGQETYNRAVKALKNWEHFDLGWATVKPPGIPMETGAVVAVLAHLIGLWSLNACRIVYVIEEETPERKFGYAYGTLPEHAEIGEERFTIEWLEDDSVWYDIYAFSRPGQVLVKLGYPVARRLQKRFAKASMARMAMGQ